ncbi:MAG: hypothetical protein JJT95_17980 [Pararhodobacter sp.]|nr:hypothetical protein [Pararhodobacter sp.]
MGVPDMAPRGRKFFCAVKGNLFFDLIFSVADDFIVIEGGRRHSSLRMKKTDGRKGRR